LFAESHQKTRRNSDVSGPKTTSYSVDVERHTRELERRAARDEKNRRTQAREDSAQSERRAAIEHEEDSARRVKRIAIERAQAEESARRRELQQKEAEAARRIAQQKARLQAAISASEPINHEIARNGKIIGDCVARFGSLFEPISLPPLIDVTEFKLSQDERLAALNAATQTALKKAEAVLLAQIKSHLRRERLAKVDGRPDVLAKNPALPLRSHADLRLWVNEELDFLDHALARDALKLRCATAEKLIQAAESSLGTLPESIIARYQDLVAATNSSDATVALAHLTAEVEKSLEDHRKRVKALVTAKDRARALLARLNPIEPTNSEAAALGIGLREFIEKEVSFEVPMDAVAKQVNQIIAEHDERHQFEERKMAISILQGCLEDLGYDVSETAEDDIAQGKSFFYRKRDDNGYATRVTLGAENEMIVALGRVQEENPSPTEMEQRAADAENHARDYQHCTSDVQTVVKLAKERGLKIGIIRQKNPGDGSVQRLSAHEIGQALQEKMNTEKVRSTSQKAKERNV